MSQLLFLFHCQQYDLEYKVLIWKNVLICSRIKMHAQAFISKSCKQYLMFNVPFFFLIANMADGRC